MTKNVLIIGLGSAGSRYAKIAIKYGCQVYGYDSDALDKAGLFRETSVKGVQEIIMINPFLKDKHQTLDLIIVATPAATHFEVVMDLLPYWVPILCEKPLCQTSEEAVRIATQQAENGFTDVSVAYQLRFLPRIAELIRIADTQKVHAIYAEYKGNKHTWLGNPDTYQDLLLECSHEIDLILRAYRGTALDKVGYWNREHDGGIFAGHCDPNWDMVLDWEAACPERKFIVEIDNGEYEPGVLHVIRHEARLEKGDYKPMQTAYEEVFRLAIEGKGDGLCTVQEAVAIHRFIDELKEVT